jgi:hypothetical protein
LIFICSTVRAGEGTSLERRVVGMLDVVDERVSFDREVWGGGVGDFAKAFVVVS